MLKDPLPNTLDVRKAAGREASIRGALRPQDLPRFRPSLAGDNGEIEAELAFSRDEENRSIVAVNVTARVEVQCQRCLETMTTGVTCSNLLAAVWTDEQARQLPSHLDPLLTGEDCNLWDLVEEELILAMPPFSYHEDFACNELLVAQDEEPPEPGERRQRPNPFDVLAQLKPGADKQE